MDKKDGKASQTTSDSPNAPGKWIITMWGIALRKTLHHKFIFPQGFANTSPLFYELLPWSIKDTKNGASCG